SLQGNSAPYLQYTYARLRSILRRVNGKLPKLNAEAIENEADLRLILKLAFFPEAVKAVSENYLPHQVANYLYDLARTINDYYEKEPILKAEENLRAARLNLVNAAAETMKTGLGLLGIKGPERM
ncbi:MAG: arginine--tRNA ligase, partial [Candidatus Colwellbacteria bacterium]|nr:arginine--tRNA ligase [Candidatus Colwellbacteria bacterium]